MSKNRKTFPRITLSQVIDYLSYLTPCYYCGQMATTVDHITPKTIQSRLSPEIENPVSATTETVRACRECNSTLGGRVYGGKGTLHDRKMAVRVHIRKKYAKYLRIPTWTEGEINDLGPELQKFVRHGLAMKHLTEMRLRW